MKYMPIIACKNCRQYDVANNESYEIDNIVTENIITIKNKNNEMKNIETKDFQNLFYVGFCITAHSSQSATFSFDYCIHEFNKLSITGRYVAISRAKQMSQINTIY